MSEHSAEKDAPFRVAPERRNFTGGTGFSVRALDGDRWTSADIGQLDTESLYRFLRSRGGDNPWAESIVLGILGHDHPYVLPPEAGKS